MKEENSTKQRTDLEQILALALIKNLYTFIERLEVIQKQRLRLKTENTYVLDETM